MSTVAAAAVDLLEGLPGDGEALMERGAAYAPVLERLSGAARGVAVVVPIYNAPDALDLCLRSLELHAQGAQVILVDDHSTDPRIARLNREFASGWPDARVVVSEQNAGFVHSVNTGILAADADRDVVLLNSDTEVTSGWLRKMQVAAAGRPDVASVSPLSNAAGIFSVPRPHADAPPPSGWNPEMCARALEDVSERAYELVPATSGFCLYIRREAIDAVGLFDDRLIRRGYGEENDFCARASAVGMRHVADDATFIHHRRAESFVGWKGVLKKQNSRVLKALHPGHLDDQRAWESSSELDVVRRRYETVVSVVGTPPHPARRGWVEPVRTRLTVSESGGAGSWGTGERAVGVSFTGDGVEVDIFGARRLRGRCAPEQRTGILAWLANRFTADEADVSGGLDRRQQAMLGGAGPLGGIWRFL